MKTTNNVAGKPGLDPTLPDVELVLGGKTYKLAYDFNAIVQAEKVTGINLLVHVVGEMSARSLVGLLWAALLPGHPEIEIEEVGRMIQPHNIPVIRSAIVTAWFGSVPSKKEKKDDGQGEAKGSAV